MSKAHPITITIEDLPQNWDDKGGSYALFEYCHDCDRVSIALLLSSIGEILGKSGDSISVPMITIGPSSAITTLLSAFCYVARHWAIANDDLAGFDASVRAGHQILEDQQLEPFNLLSLLVSGAQQYIKFVGGDNRITEVRE